MERPEGIPAHRDQRGISRPSDGRPRWSSVAAFTAAFAAITGRPAISLEDVNAAAARMTRGLIRPDYNAYQLVDAGQGANR